jgi:hypothetical protein
MTTAENIQHLAENLASEALAKRVDLETYVREQTAILSEARQAEILEIAKSIPTHTW